MQIVHIPRCGGKTPFEPSEDQYFFMTNYQLSTLGDETFDLSPMPGSAAGDYMQMGYTGISLFKRVILWDLAHGEYRKYPDKPASSNSEPAYAILGNKTLTAGSPPCKSLAEAEAYLKTLIGSDANDQYAVARLIAMSDWH